VEEGRRAVASDRASAEARMPVAVDKLIEDFERAVLKT
jgi:hypothetical protein